jgi:hypothetical protein
MFYLPCNLCTSPEVGYGRDVLKALHQDSESGIAYFDSALAAALKGSADSPKIIFREAEQWSEICNRFTREMIEWIGHNRCQGYIIIAENGDIKFYNSDYSVYLPTTERGYLVKLTVGVHSNGEQFCYVERHRTNLRDGQTLLCPIALMRPAPEKLYEEPSISEIVCIMNPIRDKTLDLTSHVIMRGVGYFDTAYPGQANRALRDYAATELNQYSTKGRQLILPSITTLMEAIKLMTDEQFNSWFIELANQPMWFLKQRETGAVESTWASDRIAMMSDQANVLLTVDAEGKVSEQSINQLEENDYVACYCRLMPLLIQAEPQADAAIDVPQPTDPAIEIINLIAELPDDALKQVFCAVADRLIK